jgi:hypothetical protein
MESFYKAIESAVSPTKIEGIPNRFFKGLVADLELGILCPVNRVLGNRSQAFPSSTAAFIRICYVRSTLVYKSSAGMR